MKKRLVIGMIVLVTSSMFLWGCKSSNKNLTETQADRQEYAKNAYELGLVEALAVIVMPPEESAEGQKLIHQAMSQELSIEEQKKVMDKVFEMLSEYIAIDEYGLGEIDQQL